MRIETTNFEIGKNRIEALGDGIFAIDVIALSLNRPSELLKSRTNYQLDSQSISVGLHSPSLQPDRILI